MAVIVVAKSKFISPNTHYTGRITLCATTLCLCAGTKCGHAENSPAAICH